MKHLDDAWEAWDTPANSKKLIRLANQRLRRAKEKGYLGLSVAQAMNYVKGEGRTSFSSSVRLSPEQRRKELKEAYSFIMSGSSTLTGYRETEASLGERIATNAGVSLKSPKEYRLFYQYLHSNAYKAKAEKVGSPTAIDDYLDFISDGTSDKQFYDDFEAFKMGEITDEQFIARKQNSKRADN